MILFNLYVKKVKRLAFKGYFNQNTQQKFLEFRII